MSNPNTVFKKPTYAVPVAPATRKLEIPEGLWTKCPSCSEVVYNQKLEENLRVCPNCDHHFSISPRIRIAALLDENSFEETDTDIYTKDVLEFPQYEEKLKRDYAKSGDSEAVITGKGVLGGIPVSIAVMDFSFVGGSMGAVVGEKISRAAERAIEMRAPLIIVSASGGARMQEGLFSVVQMAKVSGVLMKVDEAKIPYISILTNPTSGGVTASFATLGDLNIAEPGAMICFAGPRVIKETIHQELPKDFQSSEFLLDHGLLDKIVHRKELRSTLITFLTCLFHK